MVGRGNLGGERGTAVTSAGLAKPPWAIVAVQKEHVSQPHSLFLTLIPQGRARAMENLAGQSDCLATSLRTSEARVRRGIASKSRGKANARDRSALPGERPAVGEMAATKISSCRPLAHCLPERLAHISPSSLYHPATGARLDGQTQCTCICTTPRTPLPPLLFLSLPFLVLFLAIALQAGSLWRRRRNPK